MNPAEIRFTAKPARNCKGCIFDTCRSTVCHRATEVAKLRSLPDCDTGYVYVPDESDERQSELFNQCGPQAAATECSPVIKTKGNL
jgi:hypothetical protein